MKQLMLLLFGAGVVTAGAQSPGGVKGTESWFQTLPVTADLQGAYRWMDLAGDSVKLRSLDRSGKPGSGLIGTWNAYRAVKAVPTAEVSDMI